MARITLITFCLGLLSNLTWLFEVVMSVLSVICPFYRADGPTFTQRNDHADTSTQS